MSDDFKIKIGSQLDLSKAKSELNSFLNSKNNKLKIDAEIDNLNLGNIIKQFDSLSKSAGKSFETVMQKQINTMAKTQRNAFSEPLKSLTKAQKSYDDFWNKELSKPKNKNYGKNSQLLAFEEFNKQMLAQSKKSEEIRKKVSQGFTDVDTSAIRKSLNKYIGLDSNTLKEAEASYSKLISLQKELKTGISDDSFKKTLSDKDIISRAEQYDDILVKCKNQVKVLGNELSSLSKPFSQIDAVTASNKTLTWLKNNSRAAKDYGDVLEELAQKQRTAANAEDLRNYTKQVNQIKTEAASLGKTGSSMSDSFVRAFGQIFEFAGVYGMIQNVIFDGVHQMIQSVRDVNAAQIELMKVSNSPVSELNMYWDEATESAKKYGATISEVINSTADWSRLGYNLDEAKKLSDATTLLTTVGDRMTQESSSSGLISTLKGFKLQADQAESIVDKVNEVNLAASICSNVYALCA